MGFINPLNITFGSEEKPPAITPVGWQAETVEADDTQIRQKPGPVTKRAIAAARADQAEKVITVKVVAVKGTQSGTYRFAFEPGRQLSHYLSQVNLKYTASKNAVYDLTYLLRGRCRLTYVPKADSEIQIGPVSVGPKSHLQRSQASKQAERLAYNMGGPGKEHDVIDYDMRYGDRSKAKKKPVGIDDHLDVEQI